MNYDGETIAAIASGCTDSGIGIIRISGEEALKVTTRLFIPKNKKTDIHFMKSYTAHYGFIQNPENGEIIDECIILYMKGPHSYTGEDTIEIDAHGGMYVCNRILQLVCKNGARIAQPGEFTKRAFLNGRMDLTQAEAVMDVIQADNENALKISVNQLRGELKNHIIQMRSTILNKNAYIEYALDDPEHVSLDGFSQELYDVVQDLLLQIENLLKHAEDGRIVKEGIKTAIVGKPNAGKSSLLNQLLRQERAIVTEIPGTTRDTLEERAIVNGIPLNIIDTAGIRETEDIVEKIGVDKAKKVILDANLILYVMDSSRPLEKDDYDIISLIENKKVIVLLNKSDLDCELKKNEISHLLDAPVISVSMLDNIGMEEFYDTLKNMFFHGDIAMKDSVMITNERQKEALFRAEESLKQVKTSIENGMSEDFYTIDLMDAYEQLGMIIGESVHDDLVNEIFAEFCTGK